MTSEPLNILVLGGYGLIGSSIVRQLVEDGHSVTGLGRTASKGRHVSSSARWISVDIATHRHADDWAPVISGFDIVINAAGVLQSGLKDNVIDTQEIAICALITACEQKGIRQFIQISAPDASVDSDTEFYRTKARADDFLKASHLSHVIFRPGLVISSQAYGGTSLLRQLAAFPVIQPIVQADTNIQTVSAGDVAKAVSLAIRQETPSGDFDLVSDPPETLESLVVGFRNWLGFSRPLAIVQLPDFVGKIVAGCADLAGWLGWRSALRSTAMSVLKKDISGQSSDWTKLTGQTLSSFEHTLQSIPSTAQERIYARVMLAFPILLLTLACFWIISGVIGFWQFEAALGVMENRVPDPIRGMLVAGGGVLDIAIGLGLLIRPWTRISAIASILLALGYVISSAVITPHLWIDPIGPMVKVFPAIALGLAVAAISEDR